MRVVEQVIGNVDADPELAARYEEREPAAIERVVLDERERRRSRIRTTTDAGTDIGIVVDAEGLRPGDVLLDDDERMVVVAFEDRAALVVSVGDTEASTATLLDVVRLGYQVGNRHWDLAVRDSEVLVALDTESERKCTEIEAALPPGADTRREAVDPTLFDGTADHTHGTNTSHVHGQGSGDHSHNHAGHSHDHAHSPGYRTMSVDDQEDEDD